MFDPTVHSYAYMLSKYDCFRKLTGKCSLQLNEQELEEYASKEKPLETDANYNMVRENSVHYCRLLYKSIKEKGMLRPVILNPNSCGHYAFTDGQHRTCIAKTKGINTIPAELSSAWDSECRVCYFKKTNLKFRIQHWAGKTEEFIR